MYQRKKMWKRRNKRSHLDLTKTLNKKQQKKFIPERKEMKQIKKKGETRRQV